MWKNVVEWGKPQMIVWRMCFAYKITKAANNTHSEYRIVIRSTLQHLVYERASLLRYTYIAWFVKLCPRLPFPINDLSEFGHNVLHQYIKYIVYHFAEYGHSFMIHANVRNRRIEV